MGKVWGPIGNQARREERGEQSLPGALSVAGAEFPWDWIPAGQRKRAHCLAQPLPGAATSTVL